MQCNTTKVIRAFKCNMMAKKKSISDLILLFFFFISDANCHNSQGAKPCWFVLTWAALSKPVGCALIKEETSLKEGWKQGAELVAISRVHPLGDKEMSCSSQGVAKCHVQSWHKGCCTSELCFKGRSLLLSLPFACTEEGFGMCWLSPDLFLLNKLMREDFYPTPDYKQHLITYFSAFLSALPRAWVGMVKAKADTGRGDGFVLFPVSLFSLLWGISALHSCPSGPDSRQKCVPSNSHPDPGIFPNPSPYPW